MQLVCKSEEPASKAPSSPFAKSQIVLLLTAMSEDKASNGSNSALQPIVFPDTKSAFAFDLAAALKSGKATLKGTFDVVSTESDEYLSVFTGPRPVVLGKVLESGSGDRDTIEIHSEKPLVFKGALDTELLVLIPVAKISPVKSSNLTLLFHFLPILKDKNTKPEKKKFLCDLADFSECSLGQGLRSCAMVLRK